MLRSQWNDDSREFASLRFVNCDRIGKLELIELARLVIDAMISGEDYADRGRFRSDFGDVTDIAVEDIFFVVVPRLNDFVSNAKGSLKPLPMPIDLDLETREIEFV